MARQLSTVDLVVLDNRPAPVPAAPPFAKPASAGERKLSVERLTLSDFRGYRHARLDLDARPVVLVGPNGAGKTNVLEALSFLVPGRGLRGARLAEVARRDAKQTVADGAPVRPWGVAARVLGPKGAVEVGTGLVAAEAGERERRLCRVDGQAIKSQAALAEVLAVQWLTPAMDRLFVDGPAARRRFLDRLAFGFDPAHAARVAAYEHALRERARLLSEGAAGRAWDSAWLDALEATMASKGVAVAAARRDVAARLDEACRISVGPFPGARLGLKGEVEAWLDQGPALAAEDRLRAALAGARAKDAETGGAGFGPHRSDVVVRFAPKDQPAEACSTGEQKALLIAIVLGHARALADERGWAPILLLDEVTAHLDEARRQALFERIADLGAQAWLTGTDANLFAPLKGRAQFFNVRDAALTRSPRPAPAIDGDGAS